MTRQDILDTARARAELFVDGRLPKMPDDRAKICQVLKHISCGEFMEARAVMMELKEGLWFPLFTFCDGLCLGVDGAFAAIREAAE